MVEGLGFSRGGGKGGVDQIFPEPRPYDPSLLGVDLRYERDNFGGPASRHGTQGCLDQQIFIDRTTRAGDG